MRVLTAAALAAILAASGAVQATAQSQPQVLTPGGLPQDGSVIAVPPAPTIVASPSSPPMPPAPVTPTPPGLVPASPPTDAGDGSGNADNGTSPDSGSSGAAPASGEPDQTGAVSPVGGGTPDSTQDQDTIPTPPNTWQPGKTAEIGVLDKVGGGVKEISVPVGGQVVVGDLQVNVLACVIRPPDQVPDAAVFLSLQSTDSPAAPPDYRGWLLRSAPGAAVAGDASEIFRVIDCS
jgi:hypothetical protein